MGRFPVYSEKQYEEAKKNEYFADGKASSNDYFTLCDGQFSGRRLMTSLLGLKNSIALFSAATMLKTITEEVVSSGELHDSLLPYIDLFTEVRERMETLYDQYCSLLDKFVNEIDEIDEVVYSKSSKETVRRDFSKEKEERLRKKIDSGNSNQAYTVGNFVDNVWNTVNYKGVGWFERHLFDARRDSDSYMAKVLNYNDVTKRRLSDIFTRARAADKEYAVYFSDLYNDFHKVFMLVWHTLRTLEAKGIVESCSEIQQYLMQCKEILISDYGEILSNYPSDEEVVAYTNNLENREFFSPYEDPLFQEAMVGPTGGEIAEMIIFQGKAVTKSTLYKSMSVPPSVDVEDTFQYLAIKKHLASLIQSIADKGVASDSGYERSKEWLEKWKWRDKADTDPDFAVYSTLYDAAIRGLGKAKDKYPNLKGLNNLVKTVGKGYELTTEGIEILLPIFANFERNREIIAALKNGDSSDSLTDIAIAELEREYTDQYAKGMENFFSFILGELEESAVGDLKKEFLKAAGENAGGLYSAIDLSIKVTGELSGLTKASSKQLEFYSVLQVNNELRASYQKNFDIVASGSYSEQDMVNLRNSFSLLRDSCVKEYQMLSKAAGVHGDYDKMEYYDYLARTLKKKTMKDYRQGILSQDAYLSQLRQ